MNFNVINRKDCIKILVSASTLPRQILLFILILAVIAYHTVCPFITYLMNCRTVFHLCLVFMLAHSFSMGVLIELMHSSKRE